MLARAAEFAFIGLNEHSFPPRFTIQVKWNKPPAGWFKLNLDGSSLGNPSLAGGRGLIRNENGDWIRGYARAIGITTSVAAELWALRDIQMCLLLNLSAVEIEIELDAKLVVDLLKKDGDISNRNKNIVADCKEGLKQIPMVRIVHCY